MSETVSACVKETGGMVILDNTPKPVAKNDNSCKYWCFTWNNYKLEDFEQCVVSDFPKLCDRWTCQEEVGKNETRHIQGSLKFKGRGIRFSALKKKWPEIHWEKTRNIEASFKYCEKADTAVGKKWIFPIPEPPLNCLEEAELKPWMNTIIKAVSLKPDLRTINWLYDKKGGKGKTNFCRYMMINHNAIVLTGGASKDIANLVKNVMDAGNKLRHRTVFYFDIPRCTEGSISYKALEEVKNGLITNVKYESGTFLFNHPHVWVFSNSMPKTEKMSLNRWKIWKIDKLNNDLKDVTKNLLECKGAYIDSEDEDDSNSEKIQDVIEPDMNPNPKFNPLDDML